MSTFTALSKASDSLRDAYNLQLQEVGSWALAGKRTGYWETEDFQESMLIAEGLRNEWWSLVDESREYVGL